MLAIFFLPYLVPVHGGLSDSYAVGFSNRACIALLLSLSLAFGFWTRGLGLRLPDLADPESPYLSRRTLGALCIATACITAAIWLWTRPYPTFGEATYFLDRYDSYAQGAVLYRTMEWPYGPLMFYPPVWIAHALRIRYGDAHFLFWTIEWAAGIAVLWQTVRLASRNTVHRKTIFWLLLLIFSAAFFDGGSNYQPLRFFTAPLLALLLHRWHERGRPPAQIFFAAALGSAALLFYSPEQGIAFTFGTALFFAICVRPHSTAKFLGIALYLGSFGAALALAAHMGLFDSLKGFSGGALNFPLLLGLPTLVLVGLLFLTGPLVVAAFRSGHRDHRLLYLVAISLPLVSSAFSRCDPGHIFINMISAFLALLVVVSQSRTLWKWTAIPLLALGLLQTVAHAAYARGLFIGPLKNIAFSPQSPHPELQHVYVRLMQVGLGKQRAAQKFARMQADLEAAQHPNALPAGTRVFAPFGTPRRVIGAPGGVVTETGYYFSYLGLLNTDGPASKIAELRARPGVPLMLPEEEATACTQDAAAERRTLRLIFLPIYVPRFTHAQFSPQPLCTYIESHYAPSSYAAPYADFRIWLPKAADAQ